MVRASYQTKQKKAILDFLQQNKGAHITIQQISAHLQQENAAVSMPTIYRYMDALVREGAVKKYVLDGNAAACFQYEDETDMPDSSFHFRCGQCGKLLHFQSRELQQLDSQLKKSASVKIDLEQTVFYGLCGACEHSK